MFLTEVYGGYLSKYAFRLVTKFPVHLYVLIKHFSKVYASIILTKLFQKSLDGGELSNASKVARVISLHKTGEKQSRRDFRPISLTSIPCQILEHIIYFNLVNFLESN